MRTAQRLEVQSYLRKQAAYYNTAQMGMEPLVTLLATMKALAHIHQAHHWQTQGGNFYSDHLLFQRLYEESQGFIDEVAERAVGAGSVDLVDPVKIAQMMSQIVTDICGSSSPGADGMIQTSLKGETQFLGALRQTIDALEASGDLSPGTSNLLEGISDKHEQFTYLLLQRTGSRTASYDRR